MPASFAPLPAEDPSHHHPVQSYQRGGGTGDIASLPITVHDWNTPFFKDYQFDYSVPDGVLLGKGGFSKVGLHLFDLE